MLDPIRFLRRHGNLFAAVLVSALAVIGIEQDGDAVVLLPASLIVAAALSVHAAERMAALEHITDWRKAARREAELRRRAATLRAKPAEI